MTDVTEILVHWYAGRSQSEIATSLGVDRKTIRKAPEGPGRRRRLVNGVGKLGHRVELQVVGPLLRGFGGGSPALTFRG